MSEVKQAVHQRARWVWQQLQAQHERKRHVLPREYVSGETHFYLGRRHMLKVQPEQERGPGVRLWRGRLEVVTAKPDAQVVRRLLDAWHRERAGDVFARVMQDLSSRMRLRHAPPLPPVSD